MEKRLFLAMFMASLLAACASSDSEGNADTSPDVDTAETTPEVVALDPCWPNYHEDACEAAGWTWHHDVATNFCPNPEENCPPPTHSYFCALPCEQHADCEGTSAPYCGRIGYWGGSDYYHCSPFKVCVPLESPYEWDCFQPRPPEFCSR